MDSDIGLYRERERVKDGRQEWLHGDSESVTKEESEWPVRKWGFDTV